MTSLLGCEQRVRVGARLIWKHCTPEKLEQQWANGIGCSTVARAALALAFVVFLAGFVTGCAGPAPFKPGFYSPLRVSSLPQLQPVALYLFIDKRGKSDPAEVGVAMGRVIILGRDRATEPVAAGVTRAFLEGFRARGYPVVDMTQTTFDAGGPRANSQVAISGNVLEFGYQIVRGDFLGGKVTAFCTVQLQVYDMTSGRKLWENFYSKWDEDPRGRDALRMLADALAHGIEDALNDFELNQAIGTIRN